MDDGVMIEEVKGDAKKENVSSLERRQFICGVIEGFYGRPWTTEQRKDLFRKLKKWGMDSYVYAPKDDYKHRAYWRELYTVEEADHLSSLIAAAKEHGVMFYYALSPGLDMTYSNPKEIQTLKRKLDQVSQFGCEAFALLFDDIESELSKADKEVFQTFANAQVSVTNEIYTHLGNTKFLFCPTQYCASRAMPSVNDSEYLNTLGSKLNHDIDVLWTGNKVISKIITLESIQEITEVLRRPPVIWDNLHANDYDQKRVFLGPFSGRSPELIPHLRGVMTNPNCEFYANTIAVHTLAYWSQCSMDSKVNSSLSADIKLETENEEDLPAECCISKNIYHPRLALKNAIDEWLPEFFIKKEALGPITKPQPQVQMVMPIIPIIPSINTCMSLTTTTTTSTNTKTLPEVKTTQLQALADVCSTVNSSAMTPISNPIMNSLVSATKVVTSNDILNHIPTTAASNIELPKMVPISIVPVPIMHTKGADDESTGLQIALSDNNITKQIEEHILAGCQTDGEVQELKVEKKTLDEEQIDVVIGEKSISQPTLSIDTNNMLEENSLSPLSTGANEPMECSSSIASQTSPKEVSSKLAAVTEDIVMTSVHDSNIMHVESSASSPISTTEMHEEVLDYKAADLVTKITAEDLYLLCDLFYLPFEHGSRGLKLLNEFNWLKTNATVLNSHGVDNDKKNSSKPEVCEWLQRADCFSTLCVEVQQLLRKIANCDNKEICHDLYAYVWDITGALSLLNAFIKWLSLGHFPHNAYSFTQGSYTWFSKGWKEAYMSGDQEPWVFRGGLTADLQRLMPVDSGNDLFLYKLPELPSTQYFSLRPYANLDEQQVYKVCSKKSMETFSILNGSLAEFPENLKELIADSIIGAYITLSPELCIVAHDESNSIVGYAAAALDVHNFYRNMDICWMSVMREKYPKTLLDNAYLNTTPNELREVISNCIKDFHNYIYQCPLEVSNSFPAVLTAAALNEATEHDSGVLKRMLTVLLAALRANGCFGVHVRICHEDTMQLQFYNKLGFVEVHRELLRGHMYLGRRF